MGRSAIRPTRGETMVSGPHTTTRTHGSDRVRLRLRAASVMAVAVTCLALVCLASVATPAALAYPGEFVSSSTWRAASVNDLDYGVKIESTSIGGLWAAGVCSPSAGTQRVFAQSLDSSGGYLWGDIWPDGTESDLYDLAVEPFGTSYAVGTIVSVVDGGTDYGIAACYGYGALAWRASYDGPKKNDEALAVAADSDSVCVTGMSQARDGDMDVVTIKYDGASGARLWTKRYNGPWDRQDRGLAVTIRGSSIYVAGVVSRSDHSFDTVLIKYSTAGRFMWARTYDSGRGGTEWVTGLVATGSAVYMSGYGKADAGFTSADALLLKYTSSGSRSWARYSGGQTGQFDLWADIGIAPGGYVNVTGSMHRSGTGTDMATASYRPAGTRRWLRMASSTGHNRDANQALVIADDGRTYVAGDVTGPGDEDMSCICYAADGTREWWSSYSFGLGDDTAHDIALTSGGVWLAGSCSTLDYGTDFGLVCYSR
jgi:hypothetical protein